MIKVCIDRQVMQSVMSGAADELKDKIDLSKVKKFFTERYGIKTIESVEHKDSNIVVIKDQVACILDFEVCFPVSVLITTKENSNSTLPEKNDLPEKIDVVEKEIVAVQEDINAIPEEIDDMELEGLDVIVDKLVEEPRLEDYNKKL